MMTRQDFAAIAQVLAGHKEMTHEAHVALCLDMATVLRESNPRFDYKRFMEACGEPVPTREEIDAQAAQWNT